MGDGRNGRGTIPFLLFLTAALSAAVWASTGPAVAGAAGGAAAGGRGEEARATRVVGGVEYPVNDSGQTYGPAVSLIDAEANPDLVAVEMPSGQTGYVEAESFVRTPAANPEEAVAWMREGGELPPEAVYAQDGTTQVGWWVTKDRASHAVEL